jgi:hypothetical protein
VYQFSRIYWKSVKQQNLPVTIKYPEMVAQIAPHFDGADIPEFGKDGTWTGKLDKIKVEGWP